MSKLFDVHQSRSQFASTPDEFSLERFYLSLSHLSPQEISKAKLLYLETAIDRYQAALDEMKMMEIWVTILSFMPLLSIFTFPLFGIGGFLMFFIFKRLMSRTGKINVRNFKRQILRTLEAWQDDLGDNYPDLISRLETARSNTNIFKLLIRGE